MTVYRGRIQLLAKPATEWTAENPVLLNGEVGVSDPATSIPILKVGDGVRPWSTLPAISGAGGGSAPNYVVGSTTTLAPGAFATVTIDNTVSPPTISFGIPTGAPGPANTLAIGTVTTGAPGSPAAATITGTPPAQTLSLTIPMGVQGVPGDAGADGATGDTGPAGPAGPPNVLTIGTTTTGAPGSAAAATITGTSPAQVLSLTIPQGPVGPAGPTGPTGPSGPAGSTTLADPTGVIGLTAVNGVSAFGIRSDGAPALSQAIVPAWTGAHTFQGNTSLVALSGVLPGMRAALPAISFIVAGATADSRAWELIGTATQFAMRTINDAFASAKDFLLTTKAGNVITNVSFGNVTDNPSYSFLGTGLATFNCGVNLAGILQAAGIQGLDGQVLASQGAGLPPIWRSAGSGSIDLSFKFAVAVGGADPGNQFMAMNSAVYASVTGIVFDEQTVTNFEAATILSLLRVGNRVYLQQSDDSTKAVVYEVTAPATDNGTYWTVPVSFIAQGSSSTMFAANKVITAVFILSSSSISVANPSATIGLTAINGVASTAMRSDAAPALSQAINPTWTGNHIFAPTSGVPFVGLRVGTNGLGAAAPMLIGTDGRTIGDANVWAFQQYNSASAATNYAFIGSEIVSPTAGAESGSFSIYTRNAGGGPIKRVTVNPDGSLTLTAGITGAGATWSGVHTWASGTPEIRFDETDQAAGSRLWRDAVAAQIRTFQIADDAGGTLRNWLAVYRSGAAVGALEFGNATDNPSYSFLGTGAATFGGPLYAPNGTSAAPSYSFAGAHDSGFYRNAPNSDARLVYGGMESVFWSATYSGTLLPFLLADGTAAQPGLCWRTDTDTGLSRDGADAIAFSTGGVARFYIRTSGLASGVDVSAPSFTTTSARAVKRETGAPSRPASILARLRPLLYRLLDGDDREQLGLIAEEVHAVCPQLSDGKRVAYDRLAILLLAAWQDEHAVAA